MTLSLSPVAALDARCFARCCRLIGRELSLPSIEPATALDGSASAKRDGRWLAGCSVPRRAAERMLRNEKWTARSLCLAAPTHGQQIAAVLDNLGPTRAVVALVPDAAELADMLASVDLLAALEAGRLHVAWDAASLRAVFERHPGVAVPQQIARLPDADPAASAAAIAWAHTTLAALTVEQAHRLAAVAATPAGDECRLVVGRAFRLWNDAGEALASSRMTAADDAAAIDTDRPTAGTDAAVAGHVAGARVVVADRARPAWAGAVTAWVTWVTKPVVPPFSPAHPNDGLVLADAAWQAAARAAGWPDARVAVAGWPAEAHDFTPRAPAALLFDLPDLKTPTDMDDLTAQRLVWEAIRDELGRDPFAVGDDAARYVARAPARLGLSNDTRLPTDRIVSTLVAPAFALGLARWLAREGVPFTLHGRGWEAEDSLAGRWRGPVADRTAFRAAIAAAGGVIDPSMPHTRPAVAALGVPVVPAFARTPQRVLQDLAALAAGRLAPAVLPGTPSLQDAIELLVESRDR